MLQVINSLLPVSNLIFWKKSQTIDLNRTISQQIFRYLKFDFSGSVSTRLLGKIMMTKKIRGHSGKKMHRNRDILVDCMVGVVGE